MQKELRILLICPSVVINAGLTQIIGKGQGFRIAESLSNLSELSARHVSSMNYDAVILDPCTASASCITSIREHYPALQDCTLIAALNAAYSHEILDQFDSFFTINDSAAQICKRIREAISVPSHTEEENNQSVLSSREKEILAHVAQGLTNKEIADVLNISVFTVTTHRKNISQKLGIRSIAGLTVYAVMNHLISGD